MCLEDLRLARGRQLGTIATSAGALSATPILRSNPNRVAIIVSPTAVGAGSLFALCLNADGTEQIASFQDTTNTPSVLPIEIYGQAITAALFVNGAGVGTVFSVVEIVLNVNVTPFSRIEDRNKV